MFSTWVFIFYQYQFLGIRGRLLIQSQDTDVVVLLVYHFQRLTHISHIWMELRNSKGTRYLPIHDICGAFSQDLCNILPMSHALTGCDVTSSLFGIGKRKVVKTILKRDATFLKGLALTSLLEAKESAEELIRLVYARKDIKNTMSLTEVRVALGKECIPLSKIIPSQAAFDQHFLRAYYQAKIWINADKPILSSPSPTEYGWHVSNSGQFEPVMTTGTTAADALDLLVCQCKGKDKCVDCLCTQSGLECTVLCGCSDTHCLNKQQPEDDSFE